MENIWSFRGLRAQIVRSPWRVYLDECAELPAFNDFAPLCYLHPPISVLREYILNTLHFSCVPGARFDVAIDSGADADICFDARRAHGVNGIVAFVNRLHDRLPRTL